jgi:nicotinamide mononucleotide transporter
MTLIETVDISAFTEPETVPHKNSLPRDVNISIIIGLALTAFSYAVGIAVHWLTPASFSWLEAFAVFTSYSCTWLCVKERRINYPIGAISSAAYALLFYRLGLMASAVLNAYLAPYLLYGWLRWRKDTDTRPVTRVAVKMVPFYIAVAGVGYLVAVKFSQHFKGTMAWTDGLILAGSLLAQVLLDNKKLETWIIWAVVNVFAIYTYAKSGLSLVAFQYAFFLINTGIGFTVWNRSRNVGK